MNARQEKASKGQGSDNRRAGSSPNNLLTVVLEDYYHVAPLKSVVHAEQWYRFERRFALNTQKTLDLLDEFQISATFFVLGSIADEMPELVREVVDRGHEVASKGYFHHSIRHFSREGFREDLQRSREALEKAARRPVRGFRIGHRWFGPDDLWALDVLADEGFSYDSSVRPLFRRFSKDAWRRKPHKHVHGGREIWEFPLTSWSLGGLLLPISGGNYFRQLPHCAVRRAVKSWVGRANAPFLMYFHVWELDPDQPRIRAAPWTQRIRQYRNLERMEPIVRHYLKHYQFVGIADYLGLDRYEEIVPVDRQLVDEGSGVTLESPRTSISVVVPCFNEELILPYLANTLKSVEQKLGKHYDFEFIFIDDGSVDETWSALKAVFEGSDNCRIVRHAGNRGVAAAILTGIQNADTDIVCSIDCDCTYDPHQLQALIPMLTDEVDMVTASPYHTDGVVRNVPEWRLFLSKSLSSLYRLVLHHQLATYTSCFRVYRRRAVETIKLKNGGFLGVAEMLGQLDLQGRSIVECPATLEVRLLGRSKMKTLRTIVGHLRLLMRLSMIRFRLPPFRPEENEDPRSNSSEQRDRADGQP